MKLSERVAIRLDTNRSGLDELVSDASLLREIEQLETQLKAAEEVIRTRQHLEMCRYGLKFESPIAAERRYQTALKAWKLLSGKEFKPRVKVIYTQQGKDSFEGVDW